MRLSNKTILLVITGSIAAYKAPDLVRQLRREGARVVPVLSKGGAHFVSALSLQAVVGEDVHSELFSLTAEAKMGHIALSRIADLIVVAPASADFIAKMACGLADDLASTVVLAANKPILIAPAMNVEMWHALATQANIDTLAARGVMQAGPSSGELACGEEGEGRMADPAGIVSAVLSVFSSTGPLTGLTALVTAGPTREPLDPVRFISNHSSGKQGYAIAEALALAGADVTLITGPTETPLPQLVGRVVRVQTAAEMQRAVDAALPVDIAICAAAVADWRAEKVAIDKIKKKKTGPVFTFTENPDILRGLSARTKNRPPLVIGFAAETKDVAKNAADKLARKGCDWLLANDVSKGVFGTDENEILFLARTAKPKTWPRMTKTDVAQKLVGLIAAAMKQKTLKQRKA